jgi:hypothetical protein
MPPDVPAEALRFKREHLLSAAERVELLDEPSGAVAVSTPSLPHVYELNLVLAPVAADPLRAAAACAGSRCRRCGSTARRRTSSSPRAGASIARC